ncbi:dephospho-CoA kinase [Leucobacter sp. UT-8R-CII-1-4]|uniref:dephospho-CoA kinase n=1 Tax=Leucobacter sp. UT-8R-CII-1-4 TaxID=3040075 RepID=UPI0024A8929C|nr:dephospho-CoA kinase [Leucobacter sp. UT-8R-CII-1-4]MDI6024218.1 dephospho-CoA kinase [Leucobacter sp. UT-8R-CII-1-4]
MKLVALSGGIASGKSTVARRLAELGAVHVDADQLAREAVAPGSDGLQQIAARFGEGVITDEGALDRPALGQLVFENAEALNALNGIVHPEVRKLAQARLDAAEAADPKAIVIYDVPLLVEAGVQMPWDLVVITEAPADVRIKRMVELRGMSAEDAQRRIANQASDAERRAIADVVIDTRGDEAFTIAQADKLWASLQRE